MGKGSIPRAMTVGDLFGEMPPVAKKTHARGWKRDGRSKAIVSYAGKERQRLQIECQVCGKPFVAVRTTRLYCSAYCRHAAGYTPRTRPTRNCEQCGKEFVAYKKTNLWCSPFCYQRYYTEKDRPGYNSRMRAFHKRHRTATPWKHLLSGARERARNKKLVFDLTNEWAAARWTGKCELTGVQFSLSHAHRAADSPSVDRISPAEGYTQKNCRFVLWAVNSLKAEGTDSDMYRVLQSVLNGNVPASLPPAIGRGRPTG
jgi:hypothetical protein